jgi:hypothetical protein
MRTTDSTETRRPARLLTFAGGGWVLVLAGVLVLAVVAWRVTAIVRQASLNRIGDGATVASYGFDLSTCLVPRDNIRAGGRSKDVTPVLTDPKAVSTAEVELINKDQRRREHSKFLVDRERVIGVALNGQARAYPVRALAWHEVVNDTLGGVPIAVTYSYLCDSVVVYDRRVGGETLELRNSGLFYNSNPLLFDRRPDGTGESLWRQLDGRAVAGPAAAAGRVLTSIPADLVLYMDWRLDHPGTTALAADPDRRGYYKREPLPGYLQSDDLVFPVSPAAPTHRYANKTRVVVVEVAGRRTVYPVPLLDTLVDADGYWRTELGGVPLRFYRSGPGAIRVRPEPVSTPLDVRYAFWFAWYSVAPDDPVFHGEGLPAVETGS